MFTNTDSVSAVNTQISNEIVGTQIKYMYIWVNQIDYSNYSCR